MPYGFTFSPGKLGWKPYRDPTLPPHYPWDNEEIATLIYSGNGNTGGIVPTSWGTGDKIVATASSLVKEGYTFKDWNTNTNGTGTTYLPGSTVTINFSSITLYAIWDPVSNYVLSYNANGATGSVPGSVNAGANTIVSTNGNLSKTLRYVSNGSMTNQSLTFLGWNTMSDSTGVTYSAGSTITISSNTILYAIWEKPHVYTITYYGNGNTSTNFESQGYGIPGYSTGSGTIEAVQTYAWDQPTLITPGEVFRKQDPYYQHTYEFMEWNTNADGTGESFFRNNYDNYVAYNRDITLYAIWTEMRSFHLYSYMVGQNLQQAIDNNEEYITIGYDGIDSMNGLPIVDGIHYSKVMNYVSTPIKYSLALGNADNQYTYNKTFDITPVPPLTYLGNSFQAINRDFSRTGLTLLGWNTKPDGSGTFYPVGSNLYNQNRELLIPQLNNEPLYYDKKYPGQYTELVGKKNILYAIWG